MDAAFSELLAACDGVSCTGVCKSLFDASYRSCLRGYQPFAVLGGMNNASIRAIVESCMPPLCSTVGQPVRSSATPPDEEVTQSPTEIDGGAVGGGDGCNQLVRNVPVVVQVYIPAKDMRTSRCPHWPLR
jgi:hypothetical protein